jgi:hypothetical protein
MFMRASDAKRQWSKSMTEKLIWRYGCVQCQKHHYEGDRLFSEHHHWQDKHGSEKVPVGFSLIGKIRAEFDSNGRLRFKHITH